MNRALRAATMGVLLLSPVALSACSAGQVTQTATQERDKVGAMAAGRRPSPARRSSSPTRAAASTRPGDDAELQLADRQHRPRRPTPSSTSSGEGFGDVEIDDGSTPAAGRRGRRARSRSPADSTVFIGGDDATVTLTDLDEELTAGQYLELTFTFENAGEVTVPVTVATPDGRAGARRGLRLPPRKRAPRAPRTPAASRSPPSGRAPRSEWPAAPRNCRYPAG